MQFEFKAIRDDGSEVAGRRESVDRFSLARELRPDGLTLVDAKEISNEAPRHFSLEEIKLGRVKMRDKIVFAGSLAAMIGAGLSLSRALSVMERQAPNKYFARIISIILDRVSRGETLSRALSQFPNIFPSVFVSMVAAGEQSGNLPEALDNVRQQLAKNYDIVRKVRGAMIYPAIIVGVIIIIGILMMVFLVPNISSLFRELNTELPLSTRIVIGVSDFLAANVFFLVLVLVIATVGVWRWSRTKRGRRIFAALWLRLPAISRIVKNFNAAVTLRTISSLISAGVSMIEALGITARVLQNPYYQDVVKQAAESVQKGRTLSESFQGNEKLYPILAGEMIGVGEETGNLPGMLLKGAIFFEEEVEQSTKNLSTVIEPALMVLVGCAVGFFAVSIISPIYSLTQAL